MDTSPQLSSLSATNHRRLPQFYVPSCHKERGQITLSRLKKLENLQLEIPLLRDISPLSKLPNLGILFLSYSGVSDLRPLHQLENLEEVWVQQTLVSRATVDALKKARPGITVYATIEETPK